jgi:hypothetical protein
VDGLAVVPDVRQGREDLYDEARPGRLTIAFFDIRILALPNEKPFHSAYWIANALRVFRSTVLRVSHGMKIFHLHWLPDQSADTFR